jgi:hypothetical protein
MLSNLHFGVALYVLIGLVFTFSMLLKYEKDQPWYTWTGRYSLTQAYWIGYVSIVFIMMTLWWWVSISYCYHAIRAFVLNRKYRNEHS